MKPPFEIGDVYWRAIGTPRQETVPCPVCAGNRRFDVILGSGEQLSVECDGCGAGYEGPRGVINEWRTQPVAQRFEIASIESYRMAHDGFTEEWRVRSKEGDSAYLADLHATEDEAFAAAAKEAQAIEERNLAARKRKRRDTSKAGWTVRYHREQIKGLERQIARHRGKIEAQR